jgi:hypothetical protein
MNGSLIVVEWVEALAETHQRNLTLPDDVMGFTAFYPSYLTTRS